MKCNQSYLGFELVSPCPFPMMITITPRAPPYIYISHIHTYTEYWIMEKKKKKKNRIDINRWMMMFQFLGNIEMDSPQSLCATIRHFSNWQLLTSHEQRRCPWCFGGACGVMVIIVGNRHGNTRLIAFHIVLIHLGKVWIQLFSLQLWVNSRAGLGSSALVRQLV